MKKVCHIIFSPDIYKLVLFVVSLVGVCPLLVGPITPYLKLLHLYAVAVIVFDLLGEKRILRNKGRTVLVAFTLCYCVTFLSNPGLHSFSGLSNFCYFLACLMLVCSYGENSAKWNRVTSTVVVLLVTAANMVAIWMFYTKFFIRIPGRGCIGMYPSQNRLAGLFGNPNVLGMICLATIGLCAIRVSQSENKRTSAFYATAGAVNYITLLLANSRTQIYSVILFCMVLTFMQGLRKGKTGKCILLATIAAVFVGALLYFGGLLIQHTLSLFDVNYSYYLEHICDEELLDEMLGGTIFRLEDGSMLNGRVALWLSGLKAFVHKPLFGYGMDNLDAAFVQMGMEGFPVAGNLHNSYIEVLVAFGVAGFACFAVLVVIVAKNTFCFFGLGDRERWREASVLLACMAAFMLDALADSTLIASVYPTSIAFFFIAGQYIQLLESENRASGHFREEPLGVLADKLKIRK